MSEKTLPDLILEDIRRVFGDEHEVRPETYLKRGAFKEWQVRKSFGGWWKAFEAAGYQRPSKKDPINEPMDNDEHLRLKVLRSENSRLKSYIKDLEVKALSSEQLRTLIGVLDAHEYSGDFEWTKGVNKQNKTLGTPILFFSDLHLDEVVLREQIGGCNEYNREIAVQRVKNTLVNAISILKYKMSAPKYDGIIFALGGDIFSGNIHEELAETNEVPILVSVNFWHDVLVYVIGSLADEFGKVFVPCVVGNHGRLHKKPRAKNRVFDNYEWALYMFLAKYFKSDARVSFYIPDSADAQFAVYKKSILLTHGDQFKGGSGISGLFTPLMLGMARKQKRYQAMGQPFDLMMIGHFHQLLWLGDYLLINGAVKGYDEYCAQMNLPFERPQQALFIMHPEHGMTLRIPVLCNHTK